MPPTLELWPKPADLSQQSPRFFISRFGASKTTSPSEPVVPLPSGFGSGGPNGRDFHDGIR